MYEELIERLREYPDREETAGGYVEIDWQDLLDAADTIELLIAQLSRVETERDAAVRAIDRVTALFFDHCMTDVALELMKWRGAQGEG